ncbi:MAG: SUMF1/EgtB/PvdO family nonheme iron enzyme [Okeania sp. SIO2D1]|uniref:SUMF1/EgtB/PvdO family nonheme iron enzyme n=1 Tax=Okeania sp. SIO2C9 TaxID=2607791 RepID=UPI0013BBA753|nr:SUMF1/EgtB/PvdO family nonheme iron enzyme [Okeania sp. SIO2C9]NES70977.1 SUMF1/EgtB/PvdO family nonheme iron enzyme [Okeania sp. SIO2D1]
MWENNYGTDQTKLRGGSWNNNSRNCRCARRNNNNADNFNNNRGFRIVLPVSRS